MNTLTSIAARVEAAIQRKVEGKEVSFAEAPAGRVALPTWSI